jgi:hypothetical protein
MKKRIIADYLLLTRRIILSKRVGIREFIQNDYAPIMQLAMSVLPESVVLLFESTLSFHLKCMEKGIDDGRRFWVYLDDTRHLAIAGYQHRVSDPQDICWAGWFVVGKRVPPKLKISILGDMLEKCLQRAAFRTLFIEVYASEAASNIYSIYKKFNLQEVGRIKDFYGHDEDLIIMSLDLVAIRAELPRNEIPFSVH